MLWRGVSAPQRSKQVEIYLSKTTLNVERRMVFLFSRTAIHAGLLAILSFPLLSCAGALDSVPVQQESYHDYHPGDPVGPLLVDEQGLQEMRPELLDEDMFPTKFGEDGHRETPAELEKRFKEALGAAQKGKYTWYDYPGAMAVGIMYDYGLGTPEDDREALRWYREALKERYPILDLYYRIGRMYRDGRGGVNQDDVQALRFFMQSCDPYRIYLFGRELEARMTPAQRALARTLSHTSPGEYISNNCPE
jgi:hypothetical protein